MLIECQSRRQDAAGRVGDVQQLEVSLKQPVLTGSAVDHDDGRIEFFRLSIEAEAEVVLIDDGARPVFLRDNTIRSAHVDEMAFEFPFIQLL